MKRALWAALALAAAGAAWGQSPGKPGPGQAMTALLGGRFLRLVSAFLAEDTSVPLSMMDGSLWFSRLGGPLGQQEMAGELAGFFARANLDGGLPPSAVFDLGSLQVVPVEAPEWAPCYAVRVDARADFSREVAFWEDQQQ